MKASTRGLAAACLFLPGMASAAPADQTTPTVYALEPGTVLEYMTSASLAADMMPGGGEQGRFRVRYTVMSSGANGRTIFAAVDQQKDEATTPAASSAGDVGGRFTFQIESDGSLGEKMAGVPIPPFTGWTPLIDFPPIPQDEVTTIPWAIPALGMEIPVVGTRTMQNGDINVALRFDPRALGAPDDGQLGGLTGEFVYSPADNATKSLQYVLQAGGPGPDGKIMKVELGFDSNREKISRLEKSDLDALSKDVAAGVPVFEEVRQAMSGEDQDTTKAVTAINKYLTQFPEGQFAQIYSEQRRMIEKMKTAAERSARINEGAKAPDFTAKTLEGEDLKLSDLRGRVVLLDFWASWCAPCVMEMPNVKKTYDEFREKGFSVVGISADHTEQAVRDFLAKNEYDWKHIYQQPDAEGTVLEQYGIQKFPTTILLDREGTIRSIDLRGEQLHEKVAELVGSGAAQ